MIKNLLVFGFIILAFACTESNPPILLECDKNASVVLNDTCYNLSSADIPDADFRGILIEDLTGVRCVACPNAADAAAAIKSNETTNPVVVLGLYPIDPQSLTFPIDDYLDMRTEVAQLIGTNIFSFSNILPAGGVSRKVFSGETSVNIGYAKWASNSNTFTGEKGIVNIEMDKEFVDDSTVNVQGVFTFTEAPVENPFVTVMILEDNIKHPQYYSGGTDKEYKHKHVVRKTITQYNGDPLLTPDSDCSSIEKGTVFEKGWQIVLPSDVDPENASVVAFINYNAASNKEVIQCLELKLK
jgi:hypothetical protein